MLKKLSIAILSLGLITGCQSKYKEGNDYDTVKNEREAKRRNQQMSGEIEQVEVPDKVYFGFDEYSLTGDAKDALKLQADWLKQDTEIDIIIEGHCDERGTKEYNYALGARRANAVKQYLIKKGISSRRLKTVSYGKDKPEHLGQGERIWSKNRRAVTLIND
jgi:peptidoglycan-associated lipoprotein